MRGGGAPSLLNSPRQPLISAVPYRCFWLERGKRGEVSTHKTNVNNSLLKSAFIIKIYVLY